MEQNSSQFGKGHHRHAILVLVAVSVMLLLSACHLDRPGIAPPTLTVTPEWICPGDEVTVAWNYKNGEQFSSCDGVYPRTAPTDRCRTVAMSGLDTPVSTSIIKDQQSFPVSTDRTFELQAYEGPRAVPPGPLVREVKVVDLPEEAFIVSYEPQCTVEGGIRYEARPNIKTKVGPCVSITRICNVSGRILRVTAPGFPEQRLEVSGPQSCTSEFGHVPVDLHVEPVTELPVTSGLLAPCEPDPVGGRERDPMPDAINLRLQVTCDLPSESADCSR